MKFDRRSYRKSSSKQYETLEKRNLLAGDVIVFEFDQNLFLRGDAADNQVEIVGLDNGDIQVSGLDGTTVNGRSQPYVLAGSQAQIAQDLRVNMGFGNDTLFVEGIEIQNRSVVYGGPGDDSIGFFNTQVMDDFFSNLASGNDSLSVDQVHVGDNLALFGVDGSDTIGIDQVMVAGRTHVVLGEGSDSVAISNSTHVEDAAIFGFAGSDFVGLNGITVQSQASLILGAGSDDVSIVDSDFQDYVFAIGGPGVDNVQVDSGTSFAFAPIVRGVEGDQVVDGESRTAQIYTDLIVDGARLGTITELAALTPQLSTLVGALQATGLDAALNGPGPFTAFAPLNSAFAALPPGTLPGLTTQQLTDILTFHVSSDVIFAEDLVLLTEVDTLLGQPFSVDTTSGVVLNGDVTIAATDIRAKNGVIHLLNGVLLPM